MTGSTVAAIAAPLTVIQQRRSFSIRELHVARGDTVQFTNQDEFIHQLYVDNPAFKFSSNEQAPGQSIGITFPTRGTFEVRCEIHPKMMLSVSVE